MRAVALITAELARRVVFRPVRVKALVAEQVAELARKKLRVGHEDRRRISQKFGRW